MTADAVIVTSTLLREAIRCAVERQRPGMEFALVPDEPSTHALLYAVVPGKAREDDRYVYQQFAVEPELVNAANFDVLAIEAEDGVKHWLGEYDKQKEKVA